MTARGSIEGARPLSEKEAAAFSAPGTQIDRGAPDEWASSETGRLPVTPEKTKDDKNGGAVAEKKPADVINLEAVRRAREEQARKYGEGVEKDLRTEQREQKLTALKVELQKAHDLADVRLAMAEEQQRVIEKLRQDRQNVHLPPAEGQKITAALVVREKARDAARRLVEEVATRTQELEQQIAALEQGA